MRIFRFTAPDMPHAMRQVRQALGDDAVILSSDRLPDGTVEVNVAVDPDSSFTPDPEAKLLRSGSGDSPEQSEAQTTQPVGAHPANAAGLESVHERLDHLNELVARYLVAGEASQNFALRPEVLPYYQHLREQEVDPALIAELLDGLSAQGGQGPLPRLIIRLKKMITLGISGEPMLAKPEVWVLVGPTGVGKTTTLAKLAAQFSLKQGSKVGLVTLDTYRIGAAEQLKIYGRIMELPTRVAGTAAELKAALDELADMDMVLIDTVGRSPKDDDNLEEQAEIMRAIPEAMHHLVLACPTRDSDQRRIIKQFSRFNPRSFIFTKLDETQAYGPILNQMVRFGLPASFFTCGQRVPDDLETPTKENLIRRLLPSRNNSQLS